MKRDKINRIYSEYVGEVHRCNCCNHVVRRLERTCKCTICGETLKISSRSWVLVILISIVLLIGIALICDYYCVKYTNAILANAFPTPEEAAFHSELLIRYPKIKQVAYFSNAFIVICGVFSYAVIWYLFVGKLMVKHLSFQVINQGTVL